VKKTRVLVVSGFSAFFKQGGGEIEAAALRHALQDEGFEADLYGPDVYEIDYYDLVVFFSCHPSGIELLGTCRELKVKFLFWPNFWPETVKDPSKAEVARINQLCMGSDGVVFKSETEKQLFQRFFKLKEDKSLMVRWFIDECFGLDTDQNRFKNLYALDNYILSVGLIEPVKNQLLLVESTVEANINLVLIGGYRKKDYFEACMKAGKGHVTFIPHLPSQSQLLWSAYAGCDAYVEVSYDPPGRSAIEAAVFAKPLILSGSAWVDEIFPNQVNELKPNDREGLARALSGLTNLQKINIGLSKEIKNKHTSRNALRKLFVYIHSLRSGW
jgi:glycosyltransferase involved in cell wall biosynthesis